MTIPRLLHEGTNVSFARIKSERQARLLERKKSTNKMIDFTTYSLHPSVVHTRFSAPQPSHFPMFDPGGD